MIEPILIVAIAGIVLALIAYLKAELRIWKSVWKLVQEDAANAKAQGLTLDQYLRNLGK